MDIIIHDTWNKSLDIYHLKAETCLHSDEKCTN